METVQQPTIGQLVAHNYRTAAVFKKYNIDFCCNGNRTIEDAANQNNTNLTQLQKEIQLAMEAPQNNAIDYASWPLDLLADYIEKKHHRYVSTQIPVLDEYLTKIVKVHGQHHPELLTIKQLFDQSAAELTHHMYKEENMLFPFIRKMVTEQGRHGASFGTVQNPIKMMMHEHDIEGERFRKISELSANYNPPADACNTYKVAFSLLQEFEDDLHLHIHLENNILFPKAIAFEATLNS